MSEINNINILSKDFQLSVKEKGILSYKISSVAQLSPFGSIFHLKLEKLTSSYNIHLTINCIHTNFSSDTSHNDFMKGVDLAIEDLRIKIKKWKETRFNNTHPSSVEPIDVNELL